MILQAIQRKQQVTATFLFSIFYLGGMLQATAYNGSSYRAASASFLKFPVAEKYIAKDMLRPEEPREKLNAPMPVRIEKEQQDQFIDGPGQPEMKTFQSVGANNMVDLLSGDFSYNIPLLDVGGYPVNIHYNAGISPEQEPSWTGLGWNINPGNINRTMRGVPDDFDPDNDQVKTIQSVKPNTTYGVSGSLNLEVLGIHKPKMGASLGVFYNTYKGLGLELGVDATFTLSEKNKGMSTSVAKERTDTFFTNNIKRTLGLDLNFNSQTGPDFGASTGLQILDFKEKSHEVERVSNFGMSTGFNSRTGMKGLTFTNQLNETTADYKKFPGNPLQSITTLSFAKMSYTPQSSLKYTNIGIRLAIKGGAEVTGFFSNASISGYYNSQFVKKNDQEVTKGACGYLNLHKANHNDNLLIDFNRDKELQFNPKATPHIGVPQYTYDVYSISGEGISGTIRPYRSEVGYVADPTVVSTSSSGNITLEIGVGNLIKAGTNIDLTRTELINRPWNNSGNKAAPNLQYTENDKAYEAVYFKNPNEKAIVDKTYLDAIGNDRLIELALDNNTISSHVLPKIENHFWVYDEMGNRTSQTLPISSGIKKSERDKRGQVVSFFTAEQAEQFNSKEKKNYSWAINTNPVLQCSDRTEVPRIDADRKKNHISEINVLNADGSRYVYGQAAYNLGQEDVIFAVPANANSTDISNGLTGYTVDLDNTTGNNKGRDNYFKKEIMPGYAHSFLLSSVLSPDYVDVTNNGITPDDPGNAVKFNYSMAFGRAANNNSFKWRIPYQEDKANYNEGLKSDPKDDKGTYAYGEKEVWYVNSIESKNYIAVFKIVADNGMGKSVKGENGGYNTSKKLYRLESIEMYSKSDLIKKGVKAKYIKKVHFEYDYSLCKGFAGDNSAGKLTLKKIWFTYNNNPKFSATRNFYQFTYNKNINGSEVLYTARSQDRWGNYKNKSSNTSNAEEVGNADFPYSVQDKTVADKNAGLWNLSKIKLPSGGSINMEYESDDYSFVQNKRAQAMMKIAGFSSAHNSEPENKLYPTQTAFSNILTHDYVFINTDALVSNKEAAEPYIRGIDYVYLKVAVLMPGSTGTYDYVPVYAKITDYGPSSFNSGHQFWVKLENITSKAKSSPMLIAAFQFLRNNLPFSAYPGSEKMENNTQVGNALKGMAQNIMDIANTVLGFDKTSISKRWCQTVNLNRSFIKLNAGGYTKNGGGYRVKKITIDDSWDKLTENKTTPQPNAVYGQEYFYSTTVNENGAEKTISSGVATNEPSIGGEENAMRQPLGYTTIADNLFAPKNNIFSEDPVLESYYPGAGVSYSKVRVHTVNARRASANGWEETEFYTARDFPSKATYSQFDKKNRRHVNPVFRNMFSLFKRNHTTVSQGFLVQLNDMHGKVKRNATYAETNYGNPIAYTNYYYRTQHNDLDNTVQVANYKTGEIEPKQVGKDAELIIDLKTQKSWTASGGIKLNYDGFIIPLFIPIFINIPVPLKVPTYEENFYRSAATVKLVNSFGILDSIVALDKGSVISTKNLVYDGETGEVILTRTNNEFKNFIYNLNYPAYWKFPGMGPAYQNIDAVFGLKGQQLYADDGKLYNNSCIAYPTAFDMPAYFESGDELIASGMPGSSGSAETNCFCVTLESSDKAFTNKRFWIMDGAKTITGAPQNLFIINEHGKPFTGILNNIRIIRSGKRNMLGASVGSVISKKIPIKEVEGKQMLVVDENTQVINATVNTYKDLWKVDQSFHQEDSCFTDTVTVNKTLPLIKNTVVAAAAVKNGTQWLPLNTDMVSRNRIMYNYEQLLTTFHSKFKKGDRYNLLARRSILDFGIGDYLRSLNIDPNSLTINSAVLKLDAMPAKARTEANGLYYETDLNFAHETVGAHASEMFIFAINHDWDQNYNLLNFRQGSNILLGAAASNCADGVFDIKSILNNNKVFDNHGIQFNIKDDHFTSTCNSCIDNRFTRSYYLKPICTSTDVKVCFPRTFGLCEFPMPANCNLPGHCSEVSQTTYQYCPPSFELNFSYTTQACVKVCKPNITDTTNPYRWGILGNWRADRAFTFYGDRVENSAASSSTVINKEGLLKDFVSFWGYADGEFKETGLASGKWVWNSAASLFNRVGAGTETFDALLRRQSGLMGYNHYIPVAVAGNARKQDILYDGFEDYEFVNDICNDACVQPKKDVDLLKDQTGVSVYTTERHSGKYALKVNQSQSVIIPFNIETETEADLPPELTAAPTNIPVNPVTIVTGAGLGLDAQYDGFVSPLGSGSCDFINATTATNSVVNTTNQQIDYTWYNNNPESGICANVPVDLAGSPIQYTVSWSGYVQAPENGALYFGIATNSNMQIRIANTWGTFTALNSSNSITYSNYFTNGQLHFFGYIPNAVAGRLYKIEVLYYKTPATEVAQNVSAEFWWSHTGLGLGGIEIVPVPFLYNSSTDASVIPAGSTTSSVSYTCKKIDRVRQSNVLNKAFTPVVSSGKKMVVGFWLKPATVNCSAEAYPASIPVTAIITSAEVNRIIVSASKTGNRVEGWQRYEAVVELQTNDKVFQLSLPGGSTDAYLYDDLRIAPFNSNLKTFAYDPVSLRLMSEHDENNYSSFYEYDDDGTLIRIKKETEKGIMTIQETRSVITNK